jgi:uncharacterized membrane protein
VTKPTSAGQTSTRVRDEAAGPVDESDAPAGWFQRARHSNTAVWTAMLVSSLASLVASFVLSVDAIRLAENPDAELGCDINTVISCGTVANSWQASVLGFPNAFLGLVTEPVIITLAVASLAGVRFPRWMMFGVQVVYTIGLGFAYWLFQQAMFDIGALCPWCLLVTFSTTVVFLELTHVNARDNNLFLPARVHERLSWAIRANLDLVVGVVWVLVMVLAVVLKYGEALFA